MIVRNCENEIDVPGDGFPDHPDLGKLGSGTASDLEIMFDERKLRWELNDSGQSQSDQEKIRV